MIVEELEYEKLMRRLVTARPARPTEPAAPASYEEKSKAPQRPLLADVIIMSFTVLLAAPRRGAERICS